MKFILLLFFIVVVSYGQLLGMHVWQDDNALFFKLAHIEEKAGYLSAGPFGTGPYKYIATPYVPIYNTFGHNTVPYFVLTLIVYILTTVVVYKVYKAILGSKAGRVAGLLYAAGYIASDGFIRLFNSVVTSVSVMTISLLTFSYWSFFQKKGTKWYFLSLFFYFLSVELARGRTHYLIAIILIVELLFFEFKKFRTAALAPLFARLLPFGLIFYKYFVENADSRSANVGKFVLGIFRGEYYQVYGFVSSITNVFLPDWLSAIFLKNVSYRWALVSVALITFLGIFYTFKAKKRLLFFSSAMFLAWVLASREIFSVPQLNLSGSQRIIALLGGSILILLFCSFFLIKKKYKKIYALLGLWSAINIAAYSAYNPLVVYESINRYLAHSFYAVVGLLAILFVGMEKGRMSTLIKFWVSVWGLGNIISSVVYQNNVLKSRSSPARKFYKELKSFVPEAKKGDVFYFDVDRSARGYFNDAFSVASMPETTAIAWRYGLDRYDIKLFTNFDELQKEIDSENIKIGQLHSFWYKDLKLSDTSEILRNYLKGGGKEKLLSFTESRSDSEVEINFLGDIVGATPVEFSIRIIGSPKAFSESDFPIGKDSGISMVPAFDYERSKENILNFAKYDVSSQWRERTLERLHDKDSTTYWQADRILFRNKKENFTIDLRREESINRFVFINGFANNSPTDYSIEVSKDGANWTEVKRVHETRRIETNNFEVISFPEVGARFVRMTIRETLNSDSPAISEAWPVLSRFSGLDISKTEVFLRNPFAYLSNLSDYHKTLSLSGNRGSAQVYWMKGNSGNWETSEKSKLEILYDGSEYFYSLVIPPGGLKLTGIKFGNFIFPGEIKILSIQER